MIWKRILMSSFGNYARLRTFCTQRKCIFEWQKQVSKFGKLTVSSAYNLTIEPLDYNINPDGDKADINVYHHCVENQDLSQFHPEVGVEGENIQVNTKIIPPEVSDKLQMTVQIPYQYSTSIKSLGSANTLLTGLEGSHFDLQTSSGTLKFNKLKSDTISVISQSGDVICSSYVLGEADIQTADGGMVEINKLQGRTYNIKTENGIIKVRHLYCENSEFTSQDGDVDLGHVHGSTTINTISGNIIVSTVAGKLDANTVDGDIEVVVVENEDVCLTSQTGNIGIVLDPKWLGTLHLSARSINICPDIKLTSAESSNHGNKHMLNARIGSDENAKKSILDLVQGSLHISAPSGTISLKSRRNNWFHNSVLPSLE